MTVVDMMMLLVLKEWYDMGEEKRNECGMKGHEFVNSDESMMSSTAMSKNFIDQMDVGFDNWKPRKRYTLFTLRRRNVKT